MYTPADFLTMPCLPSRIAVLGAGAAGMEFAQCFALLGVHVTVYEKDKQVLPGAEPAIARRYEGICRELGIDFQFGCAVEESEIPEDVLFSALGLSFPSAPPTVDPKIFYVGDISGLSRTAYEAEAAGRAAIAAIYGKTVPSCVPFSVVSGVYDFASIGYSSVHCAEAELAESGYAFMTNRPSGFARLWGDECGCITGAELLLPGAGELAALLALLIEKGIRADELARTAFFHPGYSEILQRAGALLYADL